MVPAPLQPGLGAGASCSVTALIGADPRVIADDVWAKLLWAMLNLTPGNRSWSAVSVVREGRIVRRSVGVQSRCQREERRRVGDASTWPPMRPVRRR